LSFIGAVVGWGGLSGERVKSIGDMVVIVVVVVVVVILLLLSAALE
jgi:hypothetical protein